MLGPGALHRHQRGGGGGRARAARRGASGCARRRLVRIADGAGGRLQPCARRAQAARPSPRRRLFPRHRGRDHAGEARAAHEGTLAGAAGQLGGCGRDAAAHGVAAAGQGGAAGPEHRPGLARAHRHVPAGALRPVGRDGAALPRPLPRGLLHHARRASGGRRGRQARQGRHRGQPTGRRPHHRTPAARPLRRDDVHRPRGRRRL
mmetsp:Transcript_15535/g.42007  ORF Transcript_15535/g.42007 Transcript_15535/m.42007 type:complete len:205 (+) Transcript_15535:1497-2111(+)